jgi:hypothetical protein
MPGLASLASALTQKLSPKNRGAFLIELDRDTDKPKASVKLQYFPESLADSKTINYQQKEVPGGSLPLYQWISSGERTISFTAVFSTDVDLLAGVSTTEENADGRAVGAIWNRLKTQGAAGRNPDIRSAVAWLRQYLFPTYSEDRTYAPAHLSLFIPGSGIGAAGGNTTLASGPDSMPCVMTQCEVSYDSFFPSGLPRIASVQLAFAQIAQAGGQVVFPRRSDGMVAYGKFYGDAFPGEGGTSGLLGGGGFPKE